MGLGRKYFLPRPRSLGDLLVVDSIFTNPNIWDFAFLLFLIIKARLVLRFQT